MISGRNLHVRSLSQRIRFHQLIRFLHGPQISVYFRSEELIEGGKCTKTANFRVIFVGKKQLDVWKRPELHTWVCHCLLYHIDFYV
jgi:hypothetical protein